MSQIGWLAAILLAFQVSFPSPLAAQPPQAAGSSITYVELHRGGVDCAELFEAVSGELHWVAGSITAFTRTFGIETEGTRRLPADSVQDLVRRFPDIFAYRDHPVTGRASLAVDVEALAERLADKKSGLRRWLAGVQHQSLATMAKVSSTWSSEILAPPRIIVVMAGLHGVESSAESVAKELHRRTNLPAYVFRYPNDAPIDESAGLLVMHLQDVHRQYPNSKITLVTHSMGGLVSRAAIELQWTTTPSWSVIDRTGVDQLIQVCPPNHGSALAEYGPLLEGAEQVYRIVNRRAERGSRVLLSSITDGFNEAPGDLKPGSRFLTTLNRRSRNPRVQYTILAGNDGPMRNGLTTLISTVWDRLSASVNEPEELDRRIREVLTCAELQKGSGDGVVALESARLDGVTDWQVLEMHHLVWNELDTDAGKEMLSAVANRLGISL